jgi:hypothetical protein
MRCNFSSMLPKRARLCANGYVAALISSEP